MSWTKKAVLLVLGVGSADLVVALLIRVVNIVRVAAATPPAFELSGNTLVSVGLAYTVVLLAVLTYTVVNAARAPRWFGVVAIVYTLFAVTRCAVLIYLATFPFVTARVARVEEGLTVVESALAEYRRTHGSFPATLLELELTKSALVDPWGFEYGLHRCASQADCVEVRCVGMPSYYFAPPFHAEPVVLRKVWVSKSEM